MILVILSLVFINSFYSCNDTILAIFCCILLQYVVCTISCLTKRSLDDSFVVKTFNLIFIVTFK